MTGTPLFVAVAVVLEMGVADAHHSYGDFHDETRSIRGTIQAVEFASPHTLLTLRLDDGSIYKAVWNAARQLELQGVSRAALKSGDTAIITGHPHKDPAIHEFAKLREVRRTSDGWAWRMVDGHVSVTAQR